MKRREFLRFGVSKAADAAAEVVGLSPDDMTPNWIRPPYAADEATFLQQCTRCDRCIEACPHDVIFRLASHVGVLANGTPALDLTNRGCHLCADWPCVTACEPEALAFPEKAEGAPRPGPGKLAVVTIDETACLPYSGPECGACAGSCPVPGALTWQGSVRPLIDEALCLGCGCCLEACITEPKSVLIELVPVEDESLAGE